MSALDLRCAACGRPLPEGPYAWLHEPLWRPLWTSTPGGVLAPYWLADGLHRRCEALRRFDSYVSVVTIRMDP